ncbi:C40 family peptidase [soil metagenome]
MNFDPRLQAIRSDLADIRLGDLAGAVPRVEGQVRQVSAPLLSLHREPRFDSRQQTQALLGESLRVFDSREGWAWVQLERDGYVGYASEDDLTAGITAPTHRVAVNSTFLFPDADIKSQPPEIVTLNAAVTVTGTQGAYAQLSNHRFVYAAHLAPVESYESDPVSVAERFLHVPYLWGGKSVLGIDCSGLAQLALEACGIACPRDSDLQEAALGKPIAHDHLRRGDLVFWKGHVGFMCDGEQLLHANGHHMLTVIEPLSEAVSRIAAKGAGAITSIKRLGWRCLR